MARGSGSDRGSSQRRGAKETTRRVKKKPCALCRDKATWVDYKDVNMLRKYMSDRGKIRARRVTGNCSQHQRDVQVAIKTARELALLPYTQRTVSERGPGRGTRGGPRRSDNERPAPSTDGDGSAPETDEAAEGAERQEVDA